jgi:cyclopropane-fatty-acyl-phospholipid synthase
MRLLLDLAESGLIPDPLVRLGIRQLCHRRLAKEARRERAGQGEGLQRFLEELRRSPIAVATRAANEQHYEVPPAFFQKVLGRRLKYSCCYWPSGVVTLDAAEEAMLALTAARAELADGMEVLDLGCGWGSFTLWAAEHFPRARILAVSNSRPQGEFIRHRAARLGLTQVEAVTADMNEFDPGRTFDCIVSVEMFEHLRNWPLFLKRAARWLKPGGTLLVHVFSHRRYPYVFETTGRRGLAGPHLFHRRHDALRRPAPPLPGGPGGGGPLARQRAALSKDRRGLAGPPGCPPGRYFADLRRLLRRRGGGPLGPALAPIFPGLR